MATKKAPELFMMRAVSAADAATESSTEFLQKFWRRWTS